MIKRIIGLSILLTIGGILLLSFKTTKTPDLSAYSTSGLDLYYITPNFNEIEDNIPEAFVSPKLGKSYIGFKEAVAFKESRGDYGVVNQFGYLGKYQFGKGTLAMIGIKNKNKFLNDPELQEKAFYANLSRNKWILRRDIKWYVGKRINGIVVTESGVLAAAHLAGPGAVKKYLRSGGVEGFADAFGTTVRYYMKRFAGYDTSFVVPNRKAKAVLPDA
ncbi:peptidoglycan-binding protein LysM [Aquimarina sp. 2201CG5-10]|uniref:peptidoglycan-binding protein LysM n=1 Tax=Aquimarina callyspongiae TaxID=3098150 RepID=UPI002AB3A115|nr:peptidoglycan-binding protein LysM [Aquimarina sp. 2201CG5-10]MDY8138290.1 peptidoglycan-binding protein LysM [Aquimarina sp. 2201CG5-10]